MEYEILQELVLPKSSSIRANELYFRRSGKTIYRRSSASLVLPEGEYVDFSTYFNGFFLGQWVKYTEYENFRIRIRSRGNLIWNLCAGYPDQEEQRIAITKDRDMEWGAVRLPEEWLEEGPMICYLAAAGGEGGGEILNIILEATLPAERKDPKTALLLAEWERDRALKRNLLEFEEERQRNGHFSKIFLADQDGESRELCYREEIDTEGIRFLSRKIGNSLWNGFREGADLILKRAEKEGTTHVIFMRGDTELPPGILRRTESLLRGLKEAYRDAGLAGSLLEHYRLWMQDSCGCRWNAGAPEKLGAELELRESGTLMENCELPDAEYGGFWYCCVPVKRMKEAGLPLALRQEEAAAEYGLRIGKWITFPGIGVWNPCSLKCLPESGEYYRIRNAAIVNCLHTVEKDGGKDAFKRLLWKAVRDNIAKCCYRYAFLNLLGARDFLRGAGWFSNTDDRDTEIGLRDRLDPLLYTEELEDEILENAYFADPDTKVRELLLKREIVFRDDTGRCLYVTRNPKYAEACLSQLWKMEKNIGEYYDRAAESYRRYL